MEEKNNIVQKEQKYIISQDSLNAVANYLGNKSFGEVYKAINALNALPQTEEGYIIGARLANSIIDYMVVQRYVEVYQLIGMLQSLKPIAEEAAEETNNEE